MRFVNAAHESGLYATACNHAKPSPECACLLRHVYVIKEHSKINNRGKKIGWKFMVKFQDSPRHNPFQNLNSIVASVCALDIPYVLMLRRNVLRRYVRRPTRLLLVKPSRSSESIDLSCTSRPRHGERFSVNVTVFGTTNTQQSYSARIRSATS